MRLITEKESLTMFRKVLNDYAKSFYENGYNDALTDILKELKPFKNEEGVYEDKNIGAIADIIYTLTSKRN